jgi:hypothetical protein
MSGKIYTKYIENNIKLNLSYNGLINQSEVFSIIKNDDNNNEKNKPIIIPFCELIGSYQDIENILLNKEINIIEYIYLNKERNNQILYDEETNIKIEQNYLVKFSDYIYLYYILAESRDVVNYIFEIELIDAFNDILLATKSKIKMIILSKLEIFFIDYYFEQKDDEKIKKYEDMKNKCKQIINVNINYLKEDIADLNIDNLLSDDIENIYTEIIKSLIINGKLNDSDKTIKLLDDLEIKHIRLNKKFYDNLSKILIEKNLNKYKISDIDDISDENKMNFYRILFEYILKSSDYIFYNSFLLETRKKIIEIINDKPNQFYSMAKNNKNKEALSYLIEFEYYKEKAKSLRVNITTDNGDDISSIKYESISSYSLFGGASSEKEKTDGRSAYELINDNEINAISYKILSNSTFLISAKFSGEKKETIITYKKIFYRRKEYNENKDITINEVKNQNPQDKDLNIYYNKFLQYLQEVENEIKYHYTNEKEIEITMKFSMNKKYNLTCEFQINDNNLDEKDFTESDLLNKTNHEALNIMAQNISGD